MKYLLIIFVIALALAPLSHFVPSKRQRLIARLREYAAVHGLFVEFRDLPGRKGPTQKRVEQVIYYGKRVLPSRNKPRGRLAWLPGDDGWRGLEHRDLAPQCSTQLPAEILALSADEGSCGVYWLERGTEPDVQLIVDVLEQWSTGLNEAR